jgi:hypothetical protein
MNKLVYKIFKNKNNLDNNNNKKDWRIGNY